MTVWVITPFFETGRRLCRMLRDGGTADIRTQSRLPQTASPGDLLLIYSREQITALIRQAGALAQQCGCQAVLLLDADQYARHLDAARANGIGLQLMPVSYQTLLDMLQTGQTALSC